MRIAAEVRRVRMRPGDRGGRIVHERGEPHLRIQPVIGDHDQHARVRPGAAPTKRYISFDPDAQPPP